MTRKKRPKIEHPPETRHQAYQLWLENNKPSLDDMCKILKRELGIDVAKSTVMHWKDSIPSWHASFIEAKTKIDPAKLLAALTRAKADAKKLEPDHFLGIKTLLIARLYLAVTDITIATVDDWDRALACCDKLEALIHAERGKTVVTEGGRPAGSLMNALSPPINIAPFKKPTGNGSAA